MACYVFGNPITDETLKGIPMYGGKETIRRIDRAREAYNMKNAEGKDLKVRNYAQSLRKEWDNFVDNANGTIHDKIYFLVLIYNATGDTIRYVTKHDYDGHLGISPYPSRIANGQWAAFLHVQTLGTRKGCTGVVVYRGMNDAGEEIDWALAWSNPGPDDLANSKIYGEVRQAGHFEEQGLWEDWFKPYMEKGKGLYLYDEPKSGNPGNGGVFEGTTGRSSAPVYEAILTLQNVV